MTTPGERLFDLLLRLYPRAFRDRYRDDLRAFFIQDRNHPKYGTGPFRPVRFWVATTRDIMRTAWSHRRDDRKERPPAANRRGAWRRDLRFAWRGLWAAPGVTLAGLLVLTIGVGASTAIFSVVDAVVLRGLPYPDDDELVVISESSTRGGSASTSVRPQTYFEWRHRQRVFADLGASSGVPPMTTLDEPVAALSATRLTASLFDVLRARPALGRVFTESDEQSGARPVAILSDRLWRSRFGADPRVIGRSIALRTGTFEIVGVMAPEFRYPVSATADLWVPFVPTAAQQVRGKTWVYMLSVVGRLRPGMSVEQAAAQMAGLGEVLAAEDPQWFDSPVVLVRPWQDAIVNASVRSWMMLLLGAVAGVLLIACLNVANLLVARAIARGPELAVRTALGASRWDLSRVLLLESLMLSMLATAGGILLAFWGVEILRSALPSTVPRLATVAVDLRVMVAAAAAAVATGITFGTLPALQVSRADLVRLVAHGSRSHSGSVSSRRVRAALVVAEVAIASVLLVGSAMFLASFVRVTTVELGFDPRHVMTVTPGIASTSDIRAPSTPDERAAAVTAQTKLMTAVDRLRAVPGVIAVGASVGGRPLGGTSMTLPLSPIEQPPDVAGTDVEASVKCVTAGYLDVLRGTLVRGRWIADADIAGADRVIVLSDEAARLYFGARDPIGQRVRLGDDPDFAPPFTVVGIVRQMRIGGPEREIRPEVFVSLLQGSFGAAEIIVRTETEPMTLAPLLHAALRSTTPGEALLARPLEQDYARLIAQRKFNMVVLAIFGVVAIAVAALGIYGLMAFVVEQRRREIGVRVALGADPTGILNMVLGRAATLMIAGLALGVAAAALLERLVRAFLFEPQPHDPIVYASAAAALLASGLAAAFGPARRAARVDPLIALRTE